MFLRCALLVLGPVACTKTAEDERPTRALYELERLAFVASSPCQLGATDLSLAAALVFDRFELTREDLAHYASVGLDARRAQFQSDLALDLPGRAHWPAFLSFTEAEAVAARRGLRLPTPREWLHVAVGRRNHEKPWGGQREFFANTLVVDVEGHDYSLGRPCDVGTYENGRSRPFGCYDLHGNVWEWVNGVVPGYDARELGPGDAGEDELAARASVLGGGYESVPRATWDRTGVFFARTLPKGVLAPWIGARMCADAATYLWEQAPAWGATPAARQRVRAVAQRWVEGDPLAAAELPKLLDSLLARPAAPEALRWLAEGARETR